MNKKNTALIGAGRWGKNLARNFYQLGALHTICDANESLLDSYQENYSGVALTSSTNAVFSNPEIKRVVIAAPAIQHYVLAKEALLAGKDVYVEKPLCMNVKEAEELIAVAEKQDKILMVGHLLQYHPCVLRIKELLQSGELGKLQYIASNRLNLGAFRTEENALWNFAPHDISVILSLCGNRTPKSLSCNGAAYISEGIADTTLTTMSFEGGVKAHIFVSWLHPYKEQKLVVIGSKGMLVFDDTQSWENKLLFYREHVRWKEGSIPLANKSEPEKVDVPQSEPLRNECAHFLECCEKRVQPRTDGEEGLHVLKVLQAAQESLNRHGEAQRPERPDFYAHPTAVIDEGASVGEGSKIWHFSHVMGGSRLGKKCNLGQNVFVASDVTLGENVKVQNNVSLYSGITVEDDVFLGPSMVLTNIKNPRSEFSQRGKYAKTRICKGATIGANATIVCGITIGAYSFVGAGSVVTKDVKPYALMVGSPAKQVGWMNRGGERLDLPVKGDGEAVCSKSGERYRLEGEKLVVEEAEPAAV